MKHFRLFALALLLAAPISFAAAGHAPVRLVVDTVAGEPRIADCEVNVPVGSNVVAVLDTAVTQGCLLQWSCSALFSAPGNCFLDSIDHILAPGLPTWWAFRVDGGFSDVGVSQKTVTGGETIQFSLDQSVVFV